MHFTSLVILVLLLTGCSKVEPNLPKLSHSIPNAEEIASSLKSLTSSTNAKFLNQTKRLTELTHAYLDAPNQQTLNELQEQWLAAHIAFSHTQHGLLTNKPDGLFRLDAWPIQPGFIDNLVDYPYSGIIHDTTLEITTQTLIEQHGITDSGEVVLGFHALELLVFTRPTSDFEPGDATRERRRLLLELIANQMLSDAEEITAASQLIFEDSSPDEVVRLFLRQTLSTVRRIFRESHLVAAQGTEHCLSRDRSLRILHEEMIALRRFMVDDVAVAESFRGMDPATVNNFMLTIRDAPDTIERSAFDEIAMANAPLVLAALTHQLEALDKAANYPQP